MSASPIEVLGESLESRPTRTEEMTMNTDDVGVVEDEKLAAAGGS
jgi:hypothetical protein